METVVIEKLLTGKELAQVLNVSRSFAYSLMRRGEIPTVRMGRAVRVRQSDIENYIAKSVVITATTSSLN